MSEQRRISHPKERLSSKADTLWTQACSKDRWLGTTEDLEHGIRRVSDAGLWQFRTAVRKSLIAPPSAGLDPYVEI